MNLTAQNGQRVSRLGLASQYLKEEACVTAAFEAGINYFFSYGLPEPLFLNELKSLIATNREALLLATGSESRDLNTLRHYFDEARHALRTDAIDVFFAEYISPADAPDTIQVVLEELNDWKAKGWIRYVGISTHNRAIALKLIDRRQCEVLMHRYNMAHRKIEADVLPAAQAAAIPVIAFTCTRWGSLLEGHPNWDNAPPSAADCYRYVLHHPAVQLALTAPAKKRQLLENLTALKAASFSPEQVAYWQNYGDLVYGTGQDAFETQWL
jgi:aryl-alcohol dehydrogenase-like predicted oxidoreductase